MLRGNPSEFNDVEAFVNQPLTIDNMEVLKQVITKPDYATRQEMLGNAPSKSDLLKAEKEKTLRKKAAYQKSADILKLVKNRLGSDPAMHSYLVNELSK